MIWAAATLCFFSFFRSGKITVPIEKAFDSTKHLAWGGVTIDSTENPQLLKGASEEIKIRPTWQGSGCVHRKNKRLPLPSDSNLTIHGNSWLQGRHFLPVSRWPPTSKSSFTSSVREALKATGLPEQNFTGHSFRIRAATAAASAGIEDSVIRTLGRWSSSAYLVYIRTVSFSFSRALNQQQH